MPNLLAIMAPKRPAYHKPVYVAIQLPYDIVVGRVERSPILPVGKYWIDVIGKDDIEAFDVWLRINAPALSVEKVELFDSPGGLVNDLTRQWVLFRVLIPAPFENTRFGFPTVATEDIQSSSDTVQKPDPESPLDIFTGEEGLFKKPGFWIGVGVVTVLSVAAYSAARR